MIQPFIPFWKEHFSILSDEIFANLHGNEKLTLNLEAEETLYVRFNQNRVRQNTNVKQVVLLMTIQSNNRTAKCSLPLSGDFSQDSLNALNHLRRLQREVLQLPEDPHLVPFENHGSSDRHYSGKPPDMTDVTRDVLPTTEGLDFVGLLCSGPMISASQNSLGLSHWFSTESFYLDYSIYQGPRAVKGIYAEANWNKEEWARKVQHSKGQLQNLLRPVQKIPPGHYRTYLAPGATAELVGMLGWSALSTAALKQGQCPLRRFASGEVSLSPLLSLSENFSLGLAPQFNSNGEMAPDRISLIKKGQFIQLLTSSRSQKEYGIPHNGASEGESPRSLEIESGTLPEQDILPTLGTGFYLSELHYLNWSDRQAARLTGMTRYACFWVDKGEIVGPIEDLRFDVSLYDVLGSQLLAVGRHAEISPSVWTYGARSTGGRKTPGLLIERFAFTL